MAIKENQSRWVRGVLQVGLRRCPNTYEEQAGEIYHEAVLHSMDRKRRGMEIARRSALRVVEIIIGERGISLLNKAHTYDHELER